MPFPPRFLSDIETSSNRWPHILEVWSIRLSRRISTARTKVWKRRSEDGGFDSSSQAAVEGMPLWLREEAASLNLRICDVNPFDSFH